MRAASVALTVLGAVKSLRAQELAFRLSKDVRHKLAFWSFGDLVTGGEATYLDLPSTGGDIYARSGRGYPQGRFRGERDAVR